MRWHYGGGAVAVIRQYNNGMVAVRYVGVYVYVYVGVYLYVYVVCR